MDSVSQDAMQVHIAVTAGDLTQLVNNPQDDQRMALMVVLTRIVKL